jgi:hypothetical protein
MSVDEPSQRTCDEALSVCACVTALALCVAGCSSGGGKQSAPTSVGRPTLTTVGFSGDVRRGHLVLPHLVATFGPCPKVYADASLARLNRSIKGLDKMLVPFSATALRICKYGPGDAIVIDLSGSAVLGPPVAATLEAETNRLLAVARDYFPTCPPDVLAYFMTFASGSQRVVVRDEGCGVVTNGVRSAQADTKWLDELQRYTTATTVPDVVGSDGSVASVLAHIGWRVSFKGAPCCVGVVVVGQNPTAGSLASLGTTVTLTLALRGPAGPISPGPTGPT